MPFSAFWAPNYRTRTSKNYSICTRENEVCMAIRCEINIKKNHSSIAILGTGQTTLLTKREGCTVQVRDKQPTHTQNARTTFAQTRVKKRVLKHTFARI